MERPSGRIKYPWKHGHVLVFRGSTTVQTTQQLKTDKMPSEWKRSILVPMFMRKGDIQECNNTEESNYIIKHL